MGWFSTDPQGCEAPLFGRWGANESADVGVWNFPRANHKRQGQNCWANAINLMGLTTSPRSCTVNVKGLTTTTTPSTKPFNQDPPRGVLAGLPHTTYIGFQTGHPDRRVLVQSSGSRRSDAPNLLVDLIGRHLTVQFLEAHSHEPTEKMATTGSESTNGRDHGRPPHTISYDMLHTGPSCLGLLSGLASPSPPHSRSSPMLTSSGS